MKLAKGKILFSILLCFALALGTFGLTSVPNVKTNFNEKIYWREV